MDNTAGVGSDLWQTRVYPSVSELLGVHHQDISRYALLHTPAMQLPATTLINSSSSISSYGEEKKRDYEEDEEKEEEQQHKRNKPFRSTKSSEKTNVRVPRVSFITKSQVNNLDDGYNWRKYGQKPVRNSPFPRSYYRCTTTWCDVKKRVERSFSDPSSVITTYEGQHTHPRPPLILSRKGTSGSNGSASGSHSDLIPTLLPPQLHQFFYYNNVHQQQELSFFGSQNLITSQEKGLIGHDDEDDDLVTKRSPTQDLLDGAGLVKDHGLLQDVVSSHIVKEEH